MKLNLKFFKKNISIIPEADRKSDEPVNSELKVRIISFSAKKIVDEILTGDEIKSIEKNKLDVNWIKITGLQNKEVINNIGEKFNLHDLVLEDAVNIKHPPKFEESVDNMFIIMKILDQKEDYIDISLGSLILGKDFVITFFEKDFPFLENFVKRLNIHDVRAQNTAADFLAHSIIDEVIKHYFETIFAVSQKVGYLEDQVLSLDKSIKLEDINELRKKFNLFRRYLLPLREAFDSLVKSRTKLIKKDTHKYYVDLQDHLIQIIGIIDSFREQLTNIFELYNSNLNNSLNEILKILTLISSIFIPLTFIAGIYGMNFDNIPELHYAYGYFLVLSAFLIIGLFMIMFFKHKKWF